MTMLLTIGVVAALMAGMAVGVVLSNKPLRGSCGGVGGSCACDEAGTPGACKEGPTGRDKQFSAPGSLLQINGLE